MFRAVIVAAVAAVMLVMIAAGVGIVVEPSLRQCLRRLVGGALHARVQTDARFGKRHLRAHADAAADQRVDLGFLQKACQQSVAAAVGIHDLRVDDAAVLHIVQLELLGVAEVLEDFSVLIGDRDSHVVLSFHNCSSSGFCPSWAFHREPFQDLSYSRRDLFESEERDALLPLPDTQYEYLERKSVKVGPDFSFTFDKVHYSMPRKYLKKTLEIRAGARKIYVYNEHGDLVRTHERSYTPKSWVVIPSDMPREYSDYGYWNKPYFLARAESIGPDTKVLIQRVIEKFEYPVQSFRSCFGILRYAEKYGKLALEACCHDAILRGKCNYTYIANTISMYAESAAEPPVDRMSCTLKPAAKDTVVTGIYKDDDSKYSLENLLKRQGEGDLR